jgi:ankyrin repeat protein
MTLAEQFQARREREESTEKLFRAVSLNKVAKVKELLGKGADPNVLGNSNGGAKMLPICVAARGKFNEILHLLIQNKAKVDGISPGFGTALHAAIMMRNQEEVEALLSAGANPNGDPNSLNITQYTPLQYAAQYSDVDSGILEALLIAGADVNAKSRIGTALDSALYQSQYRTVRVLLNAGADADLINDSNQYEMNKLLTSGY